MSSLKLTTSLKQGMILTPQLRQRIEMLQMNSLEISELIQQEMIANPVLEEVPNDEETREISDNILDQNSDGNETSADYLNGAAQTQNYNEGENYVAEPLGEFAENGFSENGFSENNFNENNFSEEATGEREPETRDAFEEVDFGKEFQEYLDPGYKTQEFEVRDDAPTFEQFLSHTESLNEHLEWQLNLSQITEQTREIGSTIIGNLDGDGRMTSSDEEIAEMTASTAEEVKKVRQLIMRFEPVGCAASDTVECLLVQLEANGYRNNLAYELIENHFTDLPQNRWQHLAKKVGCTVEDISREISKIRELDPFPGRRYSSPDPIYVAPEVHIEKIDGEYVIYFTDDDTPRLRLNQSYQQLLEKNETSKETKDFIKEKMRSAVDLLRNIEHRRRTIYRVVESIVERQRDFLDKGVQFIKPMMLKDIAEDIGMHLSTISRVVNRKYAHTPQGVIELRRFFSEGMLNEDGEEVSTRITKLKIKKMIEEEDSKNPLTDDEIAKILLSKEGVKISRRTVAKYRDQMQIAGSRERRTVI